jgi:cephalosporin hydroxylase
VRNDPSAPLYREDFLHDTTYRGIPVLKSPLDLWRYQQIVWATRPWNIIETGTFKGGSALFFRDILALRALPGVVITIDTDPKPEYSPDSFGIIPVVGSSVDPRIVNVARNIVGKNSGGTMVVLDSDHSRDHVLEELRLWSPLVGQGCYLVIEDTKHPRWAEEGPQFAVDYFLNTTLFDFVEDTEIGKWGGPVTWHTWLVRK